MVCPYIEGHLSMLLIFMVFIMDNFQHTQKQMSIINTQIHKPPSNHPSMAYLPPPQTTLFPNSSVLL